MPKRIPTEAFKHIYFCDSDGGRRNDSSQFGQEKQKHNGFSLLDPSRIESRLSLAGINNYEIGSSLEGTLANSKNYNQPVPIERAPENQILLSISMFFNTNTKDNQITGPKIGEEDVVSESLDFQQVETLKNPTENEVPAELNKNLIKQKQLRKSNAIKNFANNFVKEMKSKGSFEDLKLKFGINKKSFKNIMDNLNKKVIYEKRCQKMEDIVSMISHSNGNFSNFLLEACQNFIERYPEIVMRSGKLTDKQTNLMMIRTLEQKITQHKYYQTD